MAQGSVLWQWPCVNWCLWIWDSYWCHCIFAATDIFGTWCIVWQCEQCTASEVHCHCWHYVLRWVSFVILYDFNNQLKLKWLQRRNLGIANTSYVTDSAHVLCSCTRDHAVLYLLDEIFSVTVQLQKLHLKRLAVSDWRWKSLRVLFLPPN